MTSPEPFTFIAMSAVLWGTAAFCLGWLIVERIRG